MAATALIGLLRYGPSSRWTCAIHGSYHGLYCGPCEKEGILSDLNWTNTLKSQHPNEAAPRPAYVCGASRLPTDAQERKRYPMARGLLDYFPKALAEVARCSMIANEQHNPGEPMHWAREKSTDEADCIVRHLVDRGKIDTDGLRHSSKVAWRALAMLERELDGEKV